MRGVSQQPWGQKLTSISPLQDYQSFLGLPNDAKEIYLSLSCSNIIFPNIIQSISNKFQNYFKPNHNSPVEHLQPKLCKNAPLPPLNVKICKPLTFKKNYVIANLQDILKFKILQIFGETQKFLNGSKVKRSNPKVKILNVKCQTFPKI